MNRFDTYFAERVLRYRWWIIVATILLVIGTASGVRFLTFNNDSRVFFSEENPQLQMLEALENTYTRNQVVFFMVVPQDGNVFTPKTLKMLKELTEAAWQIPYSNRVDSIINFQHTRSENDELIVEDLVQDVENLTDADIERIRETALSDPFLLNYLISTSGHVAGINVWLVYAHQSVKETSNVILHVRELAKDLHRKYPEIEIRLTGGIPLSEAFVEASKKDLSTLVPIMFLMIIIILGLMLRSTACTFATVIVILFSMLTGLGLAGWFRIQINVLSVNAPIIILTLAVADCVHLLTTMFHEMRLGKSKHEALVEAFRINLTAVFLTSITTAIGFLSMNFSDAPPFRDLGNIVAMGIIAAFFYAVFFLPSLISILPVRIKGKQVNVQDLFYRLASFVTKNYKRVFLCTSIMVVILTIGILRIDINDDFIKYFDESFEFRRDADFQIKNLTGFHSIDYSLESGEPSGIHNPEYLKTVEKFANWYRNQPEVVYVNTITDTIKQLNKNMHGDDLSYYRIPDQRNLAAQYLLLYEISLPFGHDLNNMINVSKSSLKMLVVLRITSMKEVLEMDKKARQWLKTNAPESMYTHGTGSSVIWAHIAIRNTKKMLGAIIWILLLISGILIFSFRSFKLGLVSLIPNITPALAAFGIWGLTVGEVGLALSVIASMTIGIVVDDTIHFLSMYLRARRDLGVNTSDAIHYAFKTVGMAMWVTTVVLVAGFSVLTFSHYKMNVQLGAMTIMAIVLAFVLDILLLPALLMKVEK